MGLETEGSGVKPGYRGCRGYGHFTVNEDRVTKNEVCMSRQHSLPQYRVLNTAGVNELQGSEKSGLGKSAWWGKPPWVDIVMLPETKKKTRKMTSELP